MSHITSFSNSLEPLIIDKASLVAKVTDRLQLLEEDMGNILEQSLL